MFNLGYLGLFPVRYLSLPEGKAKKKPSNFVVAIAPPIFGDIGDGS